MLQEIMLRFHQFRDWRVVDAADASGRRTTCLLLPMDVNGILLTQNDNLPYMRLMGIDAKNTPDRFTHFINPIIHKALHDELCAKGLLDPTEKSYSHAVGGIRPWGAAKDKQKNYGRKKK